MTLENRVNSRILTVAEKLFAQQGYHGTTLRQITAAAGVNLAAVNYYLGDKETLYLEVVRRRLEPINRERLARLAEAEAGASGAPVDLEDLLEILAAPLFDLHLLEDGGPEATRLLGRTLSEPLPFLEDFIATNVQPVLARFAQAARRTTPSVPPGEFLWRFTFVIGAMQHTAATLHRMHALTRGICRDHDHVAALAHFVATGARALRGG